MHHRICTRQMLCTTKVSLLPSSLQPTTTGFVRDKVQGLCKDNLRFSGLKLLLLYELWDSGFGRLMMGFVPSAEFIMFMVILLYSLCRRHTHTPGLRPLIPLPAYIHTYVRTYVCTYMIGNKAVTDSLTDTILRCTGSNTRASEV